MSTPGQPLNFEEADPAPPSGTVNVVFQADTPTPPPTSVVRNVSAYMPAMTATAPGAVPTPPNDSTKFLNGEGGWTVPPGAGGSGSGSAPSSLFSKTYYTSATRALGTVYQNTTGQPIIVMGYLSQNGSNIMTAYCDATATPSTVVNEQLNSGGTGYADCFCFIVPNNYYYKVAATSASWGQWVEWEIISGSVTFSGELSGSRALSTVYHNTSGNAMLVVADISGIGGNVPLTGLSDSSSSPTAVVWLSEEGGSSHQTLWMMIPSNDYYEVTCSGGAVAHWNEYSLPFSATKSTDYASSPVAYRSLALGIYPQFSAYPNNSGADIFTVACITLSAAGNLWGCSGGGVPPTLISCMSSSSGSEVCAVPLLTLIGEFYGLLYNVGTPTLTHWWDCALEAHVGS